MEQYANIPASVFEGVAATLPNSVAACKLAFRLMRYARKAKQLPDKRAAAVAVAWITQRADGDMELERFVSRSQRQMADEMGLTRQAVAKNVSLLTVSGTLTQIAEPTQNHSAVYVLARVRGNYMELPLSDSQDSQTQPAQPPEATSTAPRGNAMELPMIKGYEKRNEEERAHVGGKCPVCKKGCVLRAEDCYPPGEAPRKMRGCLKCPDCGTSWNREGDTVPRALGDGVPYELRENLRQHYARLTGKGVQA